MPTRRTFLKTIGHGALRVAGVGLGVGAAVGILATRRRPSPREIVGAATLRPPGALAEVDFLTHCIRCQRCSEVCSVGAIQLFGSDVGTLHGTPYIRPQEKACTMCLRCTQACPTGALKPLEVKEDVRIGVARVDERLCVSYNGRGACGACFTACPLRGKAITQELFNRPVVHTDACTGCGQCEEVCIVYDNKAIRVWPVEELVA